MIESKKILKNNSLLLSGSLILFSISSCIQKPSKTPDKQTSAKELSVSEASAISSITKNSIDIAHLPNNENSGLSDGNKAPMSIESTYTKNTTEFKFKYTLNQPAKVYAMDRRLMEISGLSCSNNQSELLGINDEKGYIFVMDKLTGKVSSTYDFGKNGDYEGIEQVGNIIYVVNSSGNIFAFDKDTEKTEKIKLKLKSKNDVEGLGYIPSENMLTLACKGSDTLGKETKDNKGRKAIYSYSLTTNKLNEEPLLVITDEELLNELDSSTNLITKSGQKKLKNRLKQFSPSGIAYNESEDLFYLVSSQGKTLIVVNRSSEVIHIDFLNSSVYTQPEGICFDSSGDLFISNEGRGLIPKLVRCSPNN